MSDLTPEPTPDPTGPDPARPGLRLDAVEDAIADVAAGRPVVVVDDDPLIRDMLSEYLTQNELRVTALRSGQEMLKLFDAEPVDLVLLDILMPDGDVDYWSDSLLELVALA